MEILYIKDPVWNPEKREWILDYGVKDYVDDKVVKYVQRVTTETLISAVRYVELLKEKVH